MKQTKICAAGLAAGCLSLAVLLGACAAGPTGESGEPASSGRSWTMDVPSVEVSYDRVGSTTLDASWGTPLTFSEAFAAADICATVRIKALDGVYYYPGIEPIGMSVFSAEILELHKNAAAYEKKEIFIAEFGTPDATYSCFPLFKPGDTLLLNLEAQTELSPGFEHYEQSFDIINQPFGIIQLIECQQQLFAMDRSFSPYLKNQRQSLSITAVDRALQKSVSEAFLNYDQVVGAGVIAGGSLDNRIFLYEDILSYLNTLNETGGTE